MCTIVARCHRRSIFFTDVLSLKKDPVVGGRMRAVLDLSLKHARQDKILRVHVTPFRTMVVVTNPAMVRARVRARACVRACLGAGACDGARGCSQIRAMLVTNREKWSILDRKVCALMWLVVARCCGEVVSLPQQLSWQILKSITGMGLLVTTGSYWVWQRTLVSRVDAARAPA
jgi:hypothetical protein